MQIHSNKSTCRAKYKRERYISNGPCSSPFILLTLSNMINLKNVCYCCWWKVKIHLHFNAPGYISHLLPFDLITQCYRWLVSPQRSMMKLGGRGKEGLDHLFRDIGQEPYSKGFVWSSWLCDSSLSTSFINWGQDKTYSGQLM